MDSRDEKHVTKKCTQSMKDLLQRKATTKQPLAPFGFMKTHGEKKTNIPNKGIQISKNAYELIYSMNLGNLSAMKEIPKYYITMIL